MCDNKCSAVYNKIVLVEPFEALHLIVTMDMATIVQAMARPDSGLEIRDRMWLKINIPNAFIGN